MYSSSLVDGGKGARGAVVEIQQEVGAQTPQGVVGDLRMAQRGGVLRDWGKNHTLEGAVGMPLEEGVQNWVPQRREGLERMVAEGRPRVAGRDY